MFFKDVLYVHYAFIQLKYSKNSNIVKLAHNNPNWLADVTLCLGVASPPLSIKGATQHHYDIQKPLLASHQKPLTNSLPNNWPPRRFRQTPSISHFSRLQGLFDTTMAAAMQTVLVSEGDAVQLCSCGNNNSCKDIHQVCSAYLGLKHAQMAIENPGSCEHCARFTMKSLRRRLARQASLSGHDPLMSSSPVPAATPQVSIPVELPTTAALSRFKVLYYSSHTQSYRL